MSSSIPTINTKVIITAQIAIGLALNQDWKEAIKANLELISKDNEDVEALNRLAYAYLKSGNLSQAKSTYRKVIKIDKYNPIAVKNIKWMENLTKNDIHSDTTIYPSPTIFLEEPGKTKIVSLVHLAPFRVLCNLITAQKVSLVNKKHSVETRDGKNIYIGALPDDLSYRLLRFMAAGNTYDAYIKNVSKNTVTLFIRELKRGKKFADIPSFTVYNNLNSQTSQEKDSPTDVTLLKTNVDDLKEEM